MCSVQVDPDAGEITVDYEGSSPASPWGINVVKNYTHAYTTFTVRSVLNPDIPNNHGSLAPIKVEAPGGLDRQRRAAATGHGPPRGGDVPAQRVAQGARPDRARLGDGRGVGCGVDDAGQRLPTTTAARSSRRCSRTPVVSGRGRPSRGSTPARTRPVSPPCRSRSSRPRRRSASVARSCGPGSGGRGQQIGGLGQTIEFSVDTTRPWQLNAVTSRLAHAPEGHLRWRVRAKPGASASTAIPSPRRPGSPCNPTTSSGSTCRAAAATERRPAHRRQTGAHDDDPHRTSCSRRSTSRRPTSPRRRRCRPSSTRATSSCDSSTTRCSPASGCAWAGRRASPNAGRLVHDHDRRRAADRRPRQGGRHQLPVGGVPAPGDAGVRRTGQRHHVQVPVSPLELRPRRTPARRPGDGAHRGLRQEGLPAAAHAGRAVAGFRVRQPRPRCRPAGPDAVELRAVPRPTTTSTTPSAPAPSR